MLCLGVFSCSYLSLSEVFQVLAEVVGIIRFAKSVALHMTEVHERIDSPDERVQNFEECSFAFIVSKPTKHSVGSQGLSRSLEDGSSINTIDF